MKNIKKFFELIAYTIFLPAVVAGYMAAFGVIAILDYLHYIVDYFKDISENDSDMDVTESFYKD
jgi:hypothetical protein